MPQSAGVSDALFASLMLTVPGRALALRVGMVDLPGPRKCIFAPSRFWGAWAMYAAVVLAFYLRQRSSARPIVGI